MILHLDVGRSQELALCGALGPCDLITTTLPFTVTVCALCRAHVRDLVEEMSDGQLRALGLERARCSTSRSCAP